MEESYVFGPYTLLSRRRILMDGDQPVQLGSRAVDILLALIERAGEVVGKDELVTRAWPDTHVEESNLRVHIAALRKALGDGQPGQHYVVNVPGRGYCFVAPVTHAALPPEDRPAPPVERVRHLPAQLVRTIGRSDVVAAVAERLPARRFVSIVGPGGIGKTTVALAVADILDARYADPARFVDLSSVADPTALPAAVATALGLPLRPGDRASSLADGLRDRQMLIVLDNCEHVLDEAAAFAEAALRAAPGIHLLATSREPLRAEGEWVHRLAPLDAPPTGSPLDARGALGYPAVELFIERAAAKVDGFSLSDADAAIVGDICRRLDGMPLAIEFAAATVDAFGVKELAQRLNDRFAILTRGRRTALPRHQTLRATLDWSYGILSSREQTALRRLSVFRGRFTIDAATAVLACADLDAAEVPGVVYDLVAKSLVIADLGRIVDGYRLLHTTRAYAMTQLTERNERAEVFRRHADFLLAFLDGSDVEREIHSPAHWRETFGRLIDDIRGAFDWAFGDAGDRVLGIRLTVASAPIWFRLSQMGEFHEHVTRALAHLDRIADGRPGLEARLEVALGHANWHVSGPGAEMAAAFQRALEIAERTGDTGCQMQALWGLWSERNVFGDYRSAARLAEQYESAAYGGGNEAELVVSDRMLALSCHFVGQQAKARRHAERILAHASDNPDSAQLGSFQFDLRVGTGAVLSRILWLQGCPDQAMRAACSAVDSALELGHTLSQCFALYAACMVAIWTGDRQAAAGHAALLIDRAAKHSLTFWQAWGRSYEIALSLTAGIDGIGGPPLGPGADDWRNPICGAQLPELMTTLCETFVDDDLVARIEADPDNWCAAEVLRAHGERTLRGGAPGAEDAAETLFRRALEIARQQDALSWELRAATSLAGLLRRQRRPGAAREILAPVLSRFGEGHGSVDLVRAGALLAALDRAERAA